jgi:hypothetical protein
MRAGGEAGASDAPYRVHPIERQAIWTIVTAMAQLSLSLAGCFFELLAPVLCYFKNHQ